MASENGDSRSILALAGEALRSRLERAAAEGQAARMYRAQAEAVTKQYQAAVKRVVDDEGGWIQIGGEGNRSLSEPDRTDLREEAQKKALRSPLIVGYLNNLEQFVVGEGPEFRAATGDDQLDEALDDWWELVSDVNGWDSLEDEIIRRTWRDGEAFIHKAVQQVQGPPDGWEPAPSTRQRLARMGVSVGDLQPDDVPAGMIFYRLRPPSQIYDPRGEVSHGIVTSSSDVQTVLGYLWSPGDEAEFVPADDMHHIKIRADSDVKRGRSLLEPLLKRNKQYEDWLEYRIMLNLFRSSVVLIKKMENASPSQVSSIRQDQVDERANAANDRKLKAFKPGTTIHSSGIDYEYKSPNLDAADAAEDGRRIQLDMASATTLPEFMFTGDSSNANFASTLVSEGPAMREFDSWRDFFEPHYAELWKDAMLAAVEAGQFRANPSRDDLEVTIDWPSNEVRDEKAHAEAQMIRFNAGILSKETWARDAGIDWEAEKERLEREATEFMDMEPPPEGG